MGFFGKRRTHIADDDPQLAVARQRLLQPIAQELDGEVVSMDGQPLGTAKVGGIQIEFWDTNISVEMEEAKLLVTDNFDDAFAFEAFVRATIEADLPSALIDRDSGMVESPDSQLLVAGLERMLAIPAVISVATSPNDTFSHVLVTMQITAEPNAAGRAISAIARLAADLRA